MPESESAGRTRGNDIDRLYRLAPQRNPRNDTRGHGTRGTDRHGKRRNRGKRYRGQASIDRLESDPTRGRHGSDHHATGGFA